MGEEIRVSFSAPQRERERARSGKEVGGFDEVEEGRERERKGKGEKIENGVRKNEKRKVLGLVLGEKKNFFYQIFPHSFIRSRVQIPDSVPCA